MNQYLRIPKNKFWGWVFSSLAIGLLIGAGAAGKQVDDLKQQLASQTNSAASSMTALQTRLDSADASLTTLSQQYSQLKTSTAASNKTATTKTSSSPATSTATPLEVLSRKITPSTIATGDYITMTAKVQGKATKVSMRILSTDGGSSSTYSLKKVSSDGATSTWRRVVRGPKTKGTYRYYATAYSATSSATMGPTVKAASFKVE